MTAVLCRPRCALACPTTSWSHVLDDSRPSPPHWRLAYLLIGLPTPLPGDEWADAIAAVAETYGPAVVVAGLEIAARYPVMAGWREAQRERATALSRSWAEVTP